MLQTMLQQAMTAKNLSSHGAAEQIGVSHSTILRALKGDKVDVDTLIKIANWLNVRPSELLNSMSDTSLADEVAVLLSHSPELEEELKEAVQRVKAGQLDAAVLRDVLAYARYKFNAPT